MIPQRYRPLATGRTGRKVNDAAVHFLLELWDYRPDAYTFIGTRRGESWRDHPIQGNRPAQIAAILDAYPADHFDIYFCPNAFAAPQRRATLALPSRYAWCDIDDADPDAYDPQPNIVWETSPNRFQGVWQWRDAAPAVIAEQISRNIWAKDGGDKGGWSATKMLRLPGTINHKRKYKKPVVTLREYDARSQDVPGSLIAVAPTAMPTVGRIQVNGLDPEKVMRRYRRRMGLQAGTLMTAKRVMRGDRSGAVYSIIVGLIAAGASDAEIMAVLLVNPYFTDKWGDDFAKAEDQIARIRAKWEASQ